ncbi:MULTISPECIES: hypothetical protein [unclassified Bradyrhizobium]|uniref:hypothetical protein n=1 Tax=unclassified Bradyrhizobium TaxID=2631580 RepID=UPI002478A1D6|nr:MULTISPECIES: hypothetical protein [unclassified Bradyrhizobium]WGR71027.1 hypothetical protein MTX24_37935 [Bradyrhizobium sp. ISRA426]WGR75864.1 hypothetical protein MTX21_23040 [Bradyrhizobium sp. ISRA430]WGR86268.1 hypothetical protein MTX25_37625 [Bradyrhizobium sp. ISRA432]
MTRIRLATAALVAVGLLAAPFAAEAKKHSAARHHGTRVVAPTYGSGAAAPVATQPRTYGSSGQSVGTVTAPSVGTYNWPSVGVTNAVPTWRNTNPPMR